FDKDFVFSRLSRLMDTTDKSIIGNITKIKIQKRIIPVINVENNFSEANTIKFNNAIVPGTLESTRFIIQVESEPGVFVNVPVVMFDLPNDNPPLYNGSGVIALRNPETEELVNSSYGTIDYAKGIVSITVLKYSGYPEDTFSISITCEPQNYDIQTTRNQILVLDDSKLFTSANRKSGIIVNVSSSYE
ncbi:MAG: hypothetical protein EBU90_07575, partial [Proteobacteria bacterium]|nr:hypothetical protein [Pseudomonadota bacterium]